MSRKSRIKLVTSMDEIKSHCEKVYRELIDLFEHSKDEPLNPVSGRYEGLEELINGNRVWRYTDEDSDAPNVVLLLGDYAILNVRVADLLFGILSDAVPLSKREYRQILNSGVVPIEMSSIEFDKVRFFERLTENDN
jgi:hypothetical protein